MQLIKFASLMACLLCWSEDICHDASWHGNGGGSCAGQEADLFIELMNSNQELPGLGASFHAVTADLTSWDAVHHSGS